MSARVKIKDNYGPYFELLSTPEQRAAEKYIRKLAKHYPRLAEQATAGPGNEGAVYVYIPRPSDEDEFLDIRWKMTKIGLDVLLDTGVSVLLMRARNEMTPSAGQSSKKSGQPASASLRKGAEGERLGKAMKQRGTKQRAENAGQGAKVEGQCGPYFDLLSTPEQRAVEKYIRKLAKYYPDLAQEATAGPGNEGAVCVYIPRPSDDEEDMKIVHRTSKISLDIYEDTGVDILLMRASRE